MKTTLKSYHIFLAIVGLSIIACRKDKDPIPEIYSVETEAYLTEPERNPALVNIDSLIALEVNGEIPFPASGSYSCKLTKPLYKESLLYNKSGSGNDFIVKAENTLTGKYYSWPRGLVIDSVNGSINVTASQGGIRYTVGFVQKGSTDTCLQNIVLAGASYMDSVYVIGKNDTLAYPFFNADLATATICSASGDEDYPDHSGHGNGDSKCEFDAADNKGKKGRANEKKVKLRTISGVINLKKTLEEGAFGTTNPANGQGLIVPVYYKLADQSAKALQKVNIQLIFFDKKTDIPVALLNYISRKSTSIRGGKLISPQGDPRPPLLIITRS